MGYVSIEFGDSQFVSLQEENILNFGHKFSNLHKLGKA